MSEGEFRLVAVAHCILNQAVRWWSEVKGEPPVGGVMKVVLERLAELGFGVYQMPCPEITFFGNPRPPMTKEEYERVEGYRLHARRLASRVCEDLERLMKVSRYPRIRVVAILGVNHSPSCAAEEISLGSYEHRRYERGTGIFLEEVADELKARGVKIHLLDIDAHDPSRSLFKLDLLKNL